MSKGKDLPPPDTSGTDPDSALKARFTIGQAPAPAAQTVPNLGTYSRPAPRPERKPSTRPDPKGMSRTSYYISEDAASAMADAVDQVIAALGDVPKHVALSALIKAGAAQAAAVATGLAEARAAELAERLKAMRESDDPA